MNCTIFMGVASSKYEGGISPIHKFGSWRLWYRISRFDRDGGVGIVRDELLLMEIVNEFAVGKCPGICGTGSSQSRRTKPFGGVRQRGWAGSGELIVNPPIVDPSPVTVTTYQQRKVRSKLVQLTTALELELILFRQKTMLVLKCQIELQKSYYWHPGHVDWHSSFAGRRSCRQK